MSFYVAGAKKSKWANPYRVGKKYTLDEKKIRSDATLINELCELDGKILGCWCKPNGCHGDVLLKLINETKSR